MMPPARANSLLAIPRRRSLRLMPSSPPSIFKIPIDILLEIFWLVSDPATLVRLAATCKPFAWLIASSIFLRHLRLPPSDVLLLGFFHRAYKKRCRSTTRAAEEQLAKKKPRCRAPKFITDSDLSSVPCGAVPAIDNVSGSSELLDFCEPLVSRCGLVVLQLRRPTNADPVMLCVANPRTQDCVYLPPFHMDLFYPSSCVLLVDDDDGDDFCPQPISPSSGSFRLIFVHEPARSVICARVFSSATGRWSEPVSTDLMPRDSLRMWLDYPAFIRGNGMVFWLGTADWNTHVYAISMRPDTMLFTTTRISFPVIRRSHHPFPNGSVAFARLADGRMCAIVAVQDLRVSVWVNAAAGDYCIDAYPWALGDVIDLKALLLHGDHGRREVDLFDATATMSVDSRVRFQRVCEQSGNVYMWIKKHGVYRLNLQTKVLKFIRKRCSASYCPYEMTWASYFSSIVDAGGGRVV